VSCLAQVGLAEHLTSSAWICRGSAWEFGRAGCPPGKCEKRKPCSARVGTSGIVCERLSRDGERAQLAAFHVSRESGDRSDPQIDLPPITSVIIGPPPL